MDGTWFKRNLDFIRFVFNCSFHSNVLMSTDSRLVVLALYGKAADTSKPNQSTSGTL